MLVVAVVEIPVQDVHPIAIHHVKLNVKTLLGIHAYHQEFKL